MLSVPSLRSRFVCANVSSNFRKFPPMPLSAVASWTTTSGSAWETARPTASASSRSRTTGCAPSARSVWSFWGEVVVPTTSWPASASSGTSCLPSAPDAPATKIFIACSFRSIRALRRGRPDLCDTSQPLVLSRLNRHANRSTVRTAEAAAVLDRLPYGQQRQRGRGHRPGGLPPHPSGRGRGDEGRLAEGVAVSCGDASQYRLPQVGACPPGGVRRAVAAGAAPHGLGARRGRAGGDGRLALNGVPRPAREPDTGRARGL